MRVNNFKELEREIVSSREHRIEKIKNELNGTRSLFQFVGDLMELYIPRMFDSVVGRGGIETKKDEGKYPHQG